MNELFKSDNANNIFLSVLSSIKSNGLESEPRSQKIKELINATLVLSNPYNNIVSVDFRNISPQYLVAEWLWYLSGAQDSEKIEFYAPFWKKIADENKKVNSNYGYYWFNKYTPQGLNQLQYLINLFIQDIDTRQAVININNTDHKFFKNKDVPCTTTMQFIIRDNKLNLIVNMRSCDLILGYCNDIFQFSNFQILFLEYIKKYYAYIKMGELIINVASLHIYEKHWNYFDEIKNIKDEKSLNSIVHINEKYKPLSDKDIVYLQNYIDVATSDILNKYPILTFSNEIFAKMTFIGQLYFCMLLSKNIDELNTNIEQLFLENKYE